MAEDGTLKAKALIHASDDRIQFMISVIIASLVFVFGGYGILLRLLHAPRTS